MMMDGFDLVFGYMMGLGLGVKGRLLDCRKKIKTTKRSIQLSRRGLE